MDKLIGKILLSTESSVLLWYSVSANKLINLVLIVCYWTGKVVYEWRWEGRRLCALALFFLSIFFIMIPMVFDKKICLVYFFGCFQSRWFTQLVRI